MSMGCARKRLVVGKQKKNSLVRCTHMSFSLFPPPSPPSTTYKTLERQLADEELGRLLVATDLTERDGSRAEAVRLLDAGARGRGLARRLGGNVLARRFAASRFTSSLLGTSHCWFCLVLVCAAARRSTNARCASDFLRTTRSALARTHPLRRCRARVGRWLWFDAHTQCTLTRLTCRTQRLMRCATRRRVAAVGARFQAHNSRNNAHTAHTKPKANKL